MTTFYSTEHPLLNAPADRPVAARTQDGSLKVFHKTYTMTGDEAAADTVVLGKLPAGAMIMKVNSFIVATGTVAAVCTVDIGDQDGSDDLDRYIDGANVAAAGTDAMSLEPLYELTDEAPIILTFATLSTPGTGTLDIYLTYREG